MPRSTHFGHRIANTRSIPILTPTHGRLCTFFPSAPAAAANIPTSPSYRPPAAMEPTPTVDSSTSSSSSCAEGFLLFFFGAGAGVGAEAGEAEAEAVNPGGADASVTAS